MQNARYQTKSTQRSKFKNMSSQFIKPSKATKILFRMQSDLPSNNSENLSEYSGRDDYGNIDFHKERQAEQRNKKRK